MRGTRWRRVAGGRAVGPRGPVRPLRVLLVEDGLSTDGATRVSVDRAARWAAAGAEVRCFVVLHREEEWPVPDAVPVVRATRRRRRWALTMASAALRAPWWARRADVVVSSRELGNGVLVARWASALARRPLAVTVQNRWDLTIDAHVVRGTRRVTTWSLRTSSLLVVVARALAPSVRQLGVPGERVAVVTNGVDVAAVRRASAQEPSVALPDAPLVVAVGRLDHQKGMDLLLRAHARVLAGGGPHHHLLVLGEGPDRAALERLREELGVGATAHLPGAVANPHAVLARAALFVLPSRWEGWVLSLCEAVSLGVPTVAADCTAGPAEILRQGAYGRLVPVEDVDALAAAVASHLQDPQELRARAERGAAAAGTDFDADAAAARHLDLLAGLAAGAGRPRGR